MCAINLNETTFNVMTITMFKLFPKQQNSCSIDSNLDQYLTSSWTILNSLCINNYIVRFFCVEEVLFTRVCYSLIANYFNSIEVIREDNKRLRKIIPSDFSVKQDIKTSYKDYLDKLLTHEGPGTETQLHY